MLMNTEHPNFDLKMELLCSLPLVPHYAAMADLASDLGLDAQAEVRTLLDELSKAGHQIVTSTIPGTGRVAAISEPGWGRAQARGQEYWRAVYAEGEANDSRS